MKKEIVVVDGDLNTGNEVCKMLAGQPFCITHVNSVAECEDYIHRHACCAVILDLDTVAIDNRIIVYLKRKHPEITILAKSERKFHPELEESLRNYIFACLTKPLDPAELQFWVRSLMSSSGCQ